MMKRMRRLPKTIKQLLEPGSSSAAALTSITGHVRSIRRQKRCTFALIEDGSTSKGLQAVFKHGVRGEGTSTAMVEKLRQLTFGAGVIVSGRLVESTGPGQDVELVVEGLDGVEVVGRCDPDTYPLQPHHSGASSSSSSGKHSAEYLREHLHLRLRTPGIQHTMRLRAKVKEALEGYLTGEQEFVYVHTPVITGIDAEGGGESFRVGKGEEGEEFFGRPAHLTVSSQLHLEAFQAALGRVYTLAPCFRAERSMTGRHLAEFWMLECEWGGESPSCDLHGLCTFVEDMLRYTIARFLHSGLSVSPPDADNELHRAAFSQKPWPRITYIEAIHILQQAQPLFTYPPTLGHSLQSEHEKYLAEVHFKSPVFVMDYPRGVKPFYMRVNPARDMETVACFDLLVPRVGELVGGSVREERYGVLRSSMVDAGLIPSPPETEIIDSSSPHSPKKPLNPYEWYLDLRRHGSVPHGGFGMGFERLILWLGVGIANIRESVGMPRWKGWMGM
ncbi:MAG: asparaginyl-tRNA synthetase [Lentinula lateritia]|nr:MAG: asparaginyl-tRNA synthetase [Lentinula lateritia]